MENTAIASSTTLTEQATDVTDAFSVHELATKLGVEKIAAHGLLQCMVKAGLAQRVGTRKAASASGRGKPTVLYTANKDVLALFGAK